MTAVLVKEAHTQKGLTVEQDYEIIGQAMQELEDEWQKPEKCAVVPFVKC